jgi:hypothetical protein
MRVAVSDTAIPSQLNAWKPIPRRAHLSLQHLSKVRVRSAASMLISFRSHEEPIEP